VSKGIISGKRSNEGVKILQTDTKISPGNSGSPLINMNGEIVGIINSKFIDEGVEGLGFAIDARYLYNVLGLKNE
jgi:serine protease Do